MISLHTTRAFLECAILKICPYLRGLNNAALNNLLPTDTTTEKYLTVRLIQSHIQEIIFVLEKKHFNSKDPKQIIKFTEPTAIVFFQILLRFPIQKTDPNPNKKGSNDEYLNLVRNTWIMQLDKEING